MNTLRLSKLFPLRLEEATLAEAAAPRRCKSPRILGTEEAAVCEDRFVQ